MLVLVLDNIALCETSARKSLQLRHTFARNSQVRLIDMDLQEHIDKLLERYLGLLDEYTRLREELNRDLSSVYQNIARANFSAERGMRYGSDQYDQRMQALRRLSIDVNEADVSSFVLNEHGMVMEEEKAQQRGGSKDEPSEPSEGVEQSEKDQAKQKKRSNPLRWFGLLVPPALRAAQDQSVHAVDQVVPRLVSVNSEMLAVEIEIRRARKKRVKAAAAEHKNKEHGLQNADTGEVKGSQMAVGTT